MVKVGSMKKNVPGFGLIIIGTEILSGSREDAHFQKALSLVKAQGYEIKYSLVIPDDPKVIVDQLKWAFARPEALFCYGGIGATPDDFTRQCAAEAAGLPVERHPEAVAVLEEMFGERAHPIRVRMAELPKDCDLIPNPVTKVAGFSLDKHHFLPGFPEMAAPMMEWILENCYEQVEGKITLSLMVQASEGEMVPMMEAFVEAHPELYFFSLPLLTQNQEKKVRLGVIGLAEAAEKGFNDLTTELDQMKISWQKES